VRQAAQAIGWNVLADGFALGEPVNKRLKGAHLMAIQRQWPPNHGILNAGIDAVGHVDNATLAGAVFRQSHVGGCDGVAPWFGAGVDMTVLASQAIALVAALYAVLANVVRGIDEEIGPVGNFFAKGVIAGGILFEKFELSPIGLREGIRRLEDYPKKCQRGYNAQVTSYCFHACHG
jgi:hypothetical protein